MITWIVGTPHCGSTLLALLLNAQPGIRSFGEVSNLCNKAKFRKCPYCENEAHHCLPQTTEKIKSLLQADESPILVDCSKNFQETAFKPNKIIYLSKTPHAYSFSVFRNGTRPHAAFLDYISLYQSHLKDYGSIPNETVLYTDLVTQTDETIERLCQFLGVEYQEESDPWQLDSHFAGGSEAVTSMTNPYLFQEFKSKPYFDSKYSQYQVIFNDEEWRSHAYIHHECIVAYRDTGKALRELLPKIGHSYDMLIPEIETAITGWQRPEMAKLKIGDKITIVRDRFQPFEAIVSDITPRGRIYAQRYDEERGVWTKPAPIQPEYIALFQSEAANARAVKGNEEAHQIDRQLGNASNELQADRG